MLRTHIKIWKNATPTECNILYCVVMGIAILHTTSRDCHTIIKTIIIIAIIRLGAKLRDILKHTEIEAVDYNIAPISSQSARIPSNRAVSHAFHCSMDLISVFDCREAYATGIICS